MASTPDRKSTRLNSSHTVIYTLSLHDALPICWMKERIAFHPDERREDLPDGSLRLTFPVGRDGLDARSEEHTSELQSHRDLHSFPTRRSSDLLDEGTHRLSPRRAARRPP